MIVLYRGRRYRSGWLDWLSLRDLLDLDDFLADGGHSVRHWWQLDGLLAEWNGLPERFRVGHPEHWLIHAVLVWASRRRSGDRVALLGTDLRRVRIVDDLDQAEERPRNAPRVRPDRRRDLEAEVIGRLAEVTIAVPSVSHESVWDLPLHLWDDYVALVDARRKAAR